MSQPQISYEFFPPHTLAGKAKLIETATALKITNPAYFSVTYGAGGSTRTRTFETVVGLMEKGMTTAPHLSWGDDSESSILSLIEKYRQLGVTRIVALRGDPPSGISSVVRIRRAQSLVNLIRQHFGDTFIIHVAAYPETHPDALSPEDDIRFLREKIESGADTCITQYFFNADSYFYFMDRCRSHGIETPIVPGIMPITNYEGLVKFSDGCGADLPRWIRTRLAHLANQPGELLEFGIEVVTNLCERLLSGGAPGIHFYTLNKLHASVRIAQNLGLG
ncbi:MAG: methylenetetrahydrofolate reductase [Pseudomonadales bacterium]|nr:methylenetetrahydrofolate reductase [Pseudomonadales bacterium]